MPSLPLVLASGSASRLKLLQDADIHPILTITTDVDESELKDEKPEHYCTRVSKLKFEAAVKLLTVPRAILLAADTTCVAGRKILHKTESREEVRKHLQIISGKRHKVMTSVVCGLVENGEVKSVKSRLVKSTLLFKRMTTDEIEHLVASDQGLNKAGGCQIMTISSRYLKFISGSFSNVVGLPMYETTCLLGSLGYKLF